MAVKNPEPLLAISAPRVDPHIEKIERRLGASQEGFRDAMMKQMQSLTDQLALVIRNQQSGPPPQVELGRHVTGMWFVQSNNLDTQVNIVQMDIIVTNETTGDHNNKIRGNKDKTGMDRLTIKVLCLDKLSRIRVKLSTIISVGDGMLRVRVGQMVRTMGVATAGAIIRRKSVRNQISSLICQIR